MVGKNLHSSEWETIENKIAGSSDLIVLIWGWAAVCRVLSTLECVLI